MPAYCGGGVVVLEPSPAGGVVGVVLSALLSGAGGVTTVVLFSTTGVDEAGGVTIVVSLFSPEAAGVTMVVVSFDPSLVAAGGVVICCSQAAQRKAATRGMRSLFIGLGRARNASRAAGSKVYFLRRQSASVVTEL